MRLHFASCALALVCFTSVAARATTFDDASGTVVLEPSTLLSVSFDDAASLDGLPVKRFKTSIVKSTLHFVSDFGLLAGNAFGAEGVEGTHALRVGVDEALLLGSPGSLAPLADGRLELSFFARADGARPEVRLVYDSRAIVADVLENPFAVVAAVRTGRATSDGWVEYSTGPVDGTIQGQPLAGIVLASDEPRAQAGGGYFIDALEVKHVTDAALGGAPCFVRTEAQTCGAGAVCIEGTCTDAAAVYGALPPKEHRRAFVARQAFLFSRLQADRHAAAAAESFATSLVTATDDAKTPEAFYRPFYEASAKLRGAGTTAAFPNRQASLSASAYTLRSTGTEIGACFGLVEEDLVGGGRGFGVFASTTTSQLRVGDVVASIDGEAPPAWLERIAAREGLLAPDADADASFTGPRLAAVIMRYARTMTVTRCTQAGACVGTDATTVTIDIDAARAVRAALIACGPRFQRGVTVPDTVDPDAYESGIVETVGDVTTVYTNGEPALSQSGSWLSQIETALQDPTGKVIVDKRRGDGGYGDSAELWRTHVRSDTLRGFFDMARAGYESADGSPSLLGSLFDTCAPADGSQLDCVRYGAFFSVSESAPVRPAKIAWLSGLERGSSEEATAFAKGAMGVRVFGPTRTVGAPNGGSVMAGFFPGWSGGTLLYSDVRIGATKDEVLAAPWQSGTGIAPDEVVVQKQSDLLANVDTMIARARAWLEE